MFVTENMIISKPKNNELQSKSTFIKKSCGQRKTIETNFTIVYQIEMMNSHYAYQFIYPELA